jgi:hypothetical protein
VRFEVKAWLASDDLDKDKTELTGIPKIPAGMLYPTPVQRFVFT